jgi:hypothetical protein
MLLDMDQISSSLSWTSGKILLLGYCLVFLTQYRYREISTFGRGTIRKFTTNSSEMKKLAARDFEDLLQVRSYVYLSIKLFVDLIQCAIPVFEGLLDRQHDKQLMKLLYRTSEWHTLAKLCMHTNQSLDLLEELTTEFGDLMRRFQDVTSSQFATMELPRETAARNRREAQKEKGLSQSGSAAAATPIPDSVVGPGSEGLERHDKVEATPDVMDTEGLFIFLSRTLNEC